MGHGNLMGVGKTEIVGALKSLDLCGLPLCIHCSLRSFGAVHGGARLIVDSLMTQGCTAFVPAFSYRFFVSPPWEQRPLRNGWDYSTVPRASPSDGMIYSPDSNDVDQEMGALAATIVAQPGRHRGNHALNSFAAVGPLASRLISKQSPLDVYGPLRELVAADGCILLMGVGLEKMTLIHLAEALAGRRLFRRWANGPDGNPAMCETGGCSEGFNNFEPALSAFANETRVGQSHWKAYPARSALTALTTEIRSLPQLTRCPNESCIRCEDAINGGPILTSPDTWHDSVRVEDPQYTDLSQRRQGS